MRYKVRYLPLAELDLTEIDAALSQFPVKASKFFAALEQKLLLLADMPSMYPIYDDFPIYRKITVLDYLVFYIADDAGKTIDVHRIINGRRDVKNVLKN